jgi:hypothetical protein
MTIEIKKSLLLFFEGRFYFSYKISLHVRIVLMSTFWKEYYSICRKLKRD